MDAKLCQASDLASLCLFANRYALTSVGGFSTGSITEDFKTSLNLCSHGFKCKYFLQRMTRGVSPKVR